MEEQCQIQAGANAWRQVVAGCRDNEGKEK